MSECMDKLSEFNSSFNYYIESEKECKKDSSFIGTGEETAHCKESNQQSPSALITKHNRNEIITKYAIVIRNWKMKEVSITSVSRHTSTSIENITMSFF